MSQVVQRRLNKKRLFLVIGAFIGLIIIMLLIVHFIKEGIKKNSIEYKLGEVGYTTEEKKKYCHIQFKYSYEYRSIWKNIWCRYI